MTAYRRWFDGLTEIVKLKENVGFKKKPVKIQQDELEFLFLVKTLEREKEKFFYFCLAHGQQVVIVKSGDKEKEKAFLGYEWSKRRGQEGMKFVGTGKLYDEADFGNPAKVNSYIRQAFLNIPSPLTGEGQGGGDGFVPPPSKGRLGGGWGSSASAAAQNIPHPHPNPPLEGEGVNGIHPDVADHVSYARLIDMMDFSRIEFDKQIFLTPKKTIAVESKWPTKRQSDLIEIISGGTPNTSIPEYWNGDIPWLSVADFNNDSRWVSTSEKAITEKGLNNSNATWLKPGDLIISARGTVGALAHLAIPMTFNQSCCGLRGRNEIDNGFLYYALLREVAQFKLNAYGSKFDSITIRTFDDIFIPLPPLDIQQKIIEEIESVEKQSAREAVEIDLLQDEIQKTITNLTYPLAAIGSISEINPGKNHIRGLADDMEFSFIEMASVSNEGVIETIAARKLTEVKQGYTCFANGDVIRAKITPCMENGKCGYVEGLTNNVGFGSTEFFVLRPSKAISGKFLYYLINRDIFRKEAEKHMTGSSGHRRVPKTFLENYQIPIPPIKDQTRIVTELDTREKRIRELKAAIVAAEGKKAEILNGYLR
ncbi:MAG: restriction endonuclease subunit S [Desulfuromonadales bacterium]